MVRSSRPPSRSELLEYVSHGSKRPDDETRLLEKKTARVRRNLNLAFRRPSRSRAPQSTVVYCVDATKEVYCITFSNQRAVRSLKTSLSHLEHGAQHRAQHGPRFANIDAGGDGKISLQAGCIDRSHTAFWPSLDATRVVSCPKPVGYTPIAVLVYEVPC